MKNLKFILAGLVTLVVTSLTSCIGSSDDQDKGQTFYVTDFMNLTEKGNILVSDENYSFTMENFADFSKAFPEPPARMYTNFSLYVPEGKTFEQVYTTPLTSVYLVGACPAAVFDVIGSKPEKSPVFTFSTFEASASKVFLNCYVYTTLAKTPKQTDFVAYVTATSSDGVVYVTVENQSVQDPENITGSYGLSFPLNEVLAGQPYKKDSDGNVVLNVNGNTVKVKL